MYMNSLAAIIFLAIVSFAPICNAFKITTFPESIGTNPSLSRSDEMKAWGPENMFEHVNGEAELLIRYGAVSLTFLSYENESADYVGVDIIDLGKPINAYGLFRLYAGCDGEEYTISDTIVLADEYTPHAVWGQYFFRINIDTSRNLEIGPVLVKDFIDYFTTQGTEKAGLPATLMVLKEKARAPCEVGYHPEHIDYDVESGPGYSFVGKNGITYYLTHYETKEYSERAARVLEEKGIQNVLFNKNSVIWTKPHEVGSSQYMNEILEVLDEGKDR